MDYLKDKQYYIDLYDLHTIEECLHWSSEIREKMEQSRDKLQKSKPKINFDSELNKCCGFIVTGIKVSRYKSKASTLENWLKKDQELQQLYDETIPPKDIICPQCFSSMEVMDKTMHDSENPKITFFCECKSCDKRRAIYADGTPWEYKRPRCKKCDVELKNKYEEDKENDTLTITTFCPNCEYKEVDFTDFKKHRQEMEKEENKKKCLLQKYRSRFCLNEKDGEECLRNLARLDDLNKRVKQERENQKDPIYQKAMKLKKLTINQLKELIKLAAEKNGYIDLKFGKPELGKYVAVDFTLNDTNSDRGDYDSKVTLRKLIIKKLANTNWRLMSDGVDYRLGILSGRLRAYEKEEELLKII